MMKKMVKIKLNRFFDKNFFDNAYESAYTVTEDVEPTDDTSVEQPEDTQEPTEPQVDETPVEETEPATEPSVEPDNKFSVDGIGEVSPEQIKEWYEKANKPVEQPKPVEPKHEEYSKDVQDAIELYKYLESNPQLVAQLQQTNPEGYQALTQRVPDETTRKIAELEEFVENQRYESYVNNLKTKYNDFDEDKVLKYAEEHDVLDLEIAYKAMKSDSAKPIDEAKIRAEIEAKVKAEIMQELKNNSLQTQSIISTGDQTSPVEEDVQLSAQEMKVARGLGMSAKEYAKWANQ